MRLREFACVVVSTDAVETLAAAPVPRGAIAVVVAVDVGGVTASRIVVEPTGAAAFGIGAGGTVMVGSGEGEAGIGTGGTVAMMTWDVDDPADCAVGIGLPQ